MLVDPLYSEGSVRVETGVYLSGHWNFEMSMRLGQQDMAANWPDFDDPEFNCYGVCDSPTQFLDMYGEMLKKDSRNCVVSFVCIKKEDQEEMGWRWHKWGPYIGLQKPTTEYLRDEPLIKEVYTYHVYVLPTRLVKNIV